MKKRYNLFLLEERELINEGSHSSDYKQYPELNYVLKYITSEEKKEDIKIEEWAHHGNLFTILETYSL